MIKKIAIYGAGGFGKEVACVLRKINEKETKWELIGFFDDRIPIGHEVSHFGTVLGGIDELNKWQAPINIAFAIGSPKILMDLVKKIDNNNVSYPNIIHPESFFADPMSLKIGIGNVIVRGCSFSCDVSIGDFNQFNSISALAHDVQVGSFNVFMPLVRISGEAQIGDFNFFGINSIVLQRVKIGNFTKIGAGSFVMHSTRDGELYLGNPARRF